MDGRIPRLALLTAALGALLHAGPARADAYLDDFHPNQTFWSAGWEVGIPVLDLRSQWVDALSPQSGQFEVRVGVLGRLSLGAAFNLNWFQQNFDSLQVQQGQYTFTGPVYRRFSAIGLRGTVHYYLTQTAIQPYVGAGVGVIWTSTRRQTATLQESTNSSYLAVDPEIGVLFNVIPRFAFYVLGRYQWTQASFAGVHNASWIGAQLGVAYYY
jgi:hypothetical protein